MVAFVKAYRSRFLGRLPGARGLTPLPCQSMRPHKLMTAGVLLCLSAAASAQVVIPPDVFPTPSAKDRELLKDAIDIHSHLDPDSFGAHSAQAARALDVI